MLTPEFAVPSGSAPERSGSVGERARGIAADQRGAIMVLGIFMCSVIVGLLWYVAGIGDAIVYRDRMQEAADAVAFSGATLHARGMNLIVLINLLMAVVLAVRVALKMLILALTIATVIFGIIGLIPFCCQWALAIADITGDAASELQSVLSDTIDPIIDEVLEALHTFEGVIARVVPPAASLGAVMVGEKYKPPVDVPVGTDLDEITSGLPIEDGTEDQLCGKAGEAAAMVIAWPLSKIGLGKGASLFKGIMGDIARGGAAYFCEMGSGGPPPDLDSVFDGQADDACDKKQEQARIDYTDAKTAWHQACNATNPPASCTDPDPFLNGDQAQLTYDQNKLTLAQISNLKSLQTNVDSKNSAYENFDKDQCKKDTKKDMKQKMNAKQSSSSSSSSSGNKKPAKVSQDWKNGVQNAQFMSLIEGKTDSLRFGPRGVRVGAFKSKKAHDPAEPLSTKGSFAQAEFFYDCSGDWDGGNCNNEKGTHEEAMWHFRWRARLRRYTEPNAIAKAAVIGALADWGLQFKRFPLYSLDKGNEALRIKLQGMALGGVTNANEVLVLH